MKLIRGFGLISNNDMKLYTIFAMLANRREEIIVTRLIQNNRGIAVDEGADNSHGCAILIIFLIYHNHRVQTWMVLENCIS